MRTSSRTFAGEWRGSRRSAERRGWSSVRSRSRRAHPAVRFAAPDPGSRPACPALLGPSNFPGAAFGFGPEGPSDGPGGRILGAGTVVEGQERRRRRARTGAMSRRKGLGGGPARSVGPARRVARPGGRATSGARLATSTLPLTIVRPSTSSSGRAQRQRGSRGRRRCHCRAGPVPGRCR